jgi:hypothetical protein
LNPNERREAEAEIERLEDRIGQLSRILNSSNANPANLRLVTQELRRREARLDQLWKLLRPCFLADGSGYLETGAETPTCASCGDWTDERAKFERPWRDGGLCETCWARGSGASTPEEAINRRLAAQEGT